MRRAEASGPSRAVQQFLPFLHARDAVGNHTLATRDALIEAGFRSDLWAAHVERELAGLTRPYRQYGGRLQRWRSRTRDVLLYQASTGASEMVAFLLERREPLVLYYHNITPASFFEPYDAWAAQSMREARTDLQRLTERARVGLAASEFSAGELRQMGVDDVRVVPPFVAAGPSAVPPDPQYLRTLMRTRRDLDLLFVSRIVPHKGHLHLLRMLAALRASGVDARLFIVGASGPRPFMDALARLRRQLSLEESVILTGPISDAELAAHYQEADLFTSLSEHEGFAIPLLEAMRAGTPILAYDAGAVAETMNGAGILVRTLDPYLLAEAIVQTWQDQPLRSQLCERQRARADQLDAIPRARLLVEAVEAL